MAIFLFFVFIVGVVITKALVKWILNSSSVIGLIVVTTLGFCQGILVGNSILTKKESYTQKEHKHILAKLWVFSGIVLSVLIVFFIIEERLLMLAFTIAVGLWVTNSLVIPVYADLIRKYV